MEKLTQIEGKESIAIGATIQGFFTILSRIFGMVRDLMISHIFGANIFTDAFWIAFTIPNVLRQFFAEGAFGVAFVPVFIATKEKSGLEDAKKFFQNAFGFLLLSLFFIVIFCIIFAKFLVYIFAFGFSKNNYQFELTIQLTRFLFPYIIFVSLMALFGAYLQCFKKFAAMSATPILLNFSMIMAMYYWLNIFEPPIWNLVFGVLIGGIFQAILMITELYRLGLWQWPQFNFNNEAMNHFKKLVLPGLFGILIYQLNIVVIRQLASFLGEGQISYYYNADRLTQLAIGVFGVSIANAALPEIGLNFARLGEKGLWKTLNYSLTITSFVITPCALGLAFFAKPLIFVLFLHGSFGLKDVEETAKTLIAFSPSIIPFCFSRFIIQCFYTLGNTKIPVRLGLISLTLNFFLGLLLLRLKVAGLAFTISISSTLQFFALVFCLKKTLNINELGILKPFLIHLSLGFLACLVGYPIMRYITWESGLNIANAIALLFLAATCGITYFGLALIFGLTEAKKISEKAFDIIRIKK